MDLLGKFTKEPLPHNRILTTDVGYIWRRRHIIFSLLEIDITDSREKLKKLRAETHENISLTSWIIKCIAKAASEYPEAHAVRKRRKIYKFDDVDVAVLAEKELNNEHFPLPFIIRKANEKTMQEITGEIQSAKSKKLEEDRVILADHVSGSASAYFQKLPGFLRRFIWRVMLSKPLTVKKMMGTVVVTPVGTFGRASGWAIPTSISPLCFAIGSITKKPGVAADRIEIREFLHLTALLDHNVIDGAPAARFISRLTELMEKGYNI